MGCGLCLRSSTHIVTSERVGRTRALDFTSAALVRLNMKTLIMHRSKSRRELSFSLTSSISECTNKRLRILDSETKTDKSKGYTVRQLFILWEVIEDSITIEKIIHIQPWWGGERIILLWVAAAACPKASRNPSKSLKTNGMQKWSKAQSSVRLFWTGVPVRSSRRGNIYCSSSNLYSTCTNIRYQCALEQSGNCIWQLLAIEWRKCTLFKQIETRKC